MRELDENQIDFLKDLVKSEGWKIFQELANEQIDMARKQATQREEIVKDPNTAIWNAGEASGMERTAKLVNKYFD